MAKANSNYVKNRLKISLDYPFKRDTEKPHDSAQDDTVRNLTPRRMILPRTSEKYEYLGEILTKIENILIQWSVAQAGSNDETNWGPKIPLNCPFNKKDSRAGSLQTQQASSIVDAGNVS